jgi:hypothetical protein
VALRSRRRHNSELTFGYTLAVQRANVGASPQRRTISLTLHSPPLRMLQQRPKRATLVRVCTQISTIWYIFMVCFRLTGECMAR